MSSAIFTSHQHEFTATAREVEPSDPHHRPPTVLSVSGYIDASNLNEVTRRAQTLFEQRRDVVIDLSELHFIGTCGLRVVVGLPQTAFAQELGCTVVSNRKVDRLLRLMDGHRPLWVFDHLREAGDALLSGTCRREAT
ncbi:STAS domain-containing protein [Tsukamurella sp. 8F]|uniref:STAS domain-containing protein n=1 Tax=unclassified Tsukamurella TaxID=2633480 RepID=UPI0023BA3138|nr:MULTISPECIES: STAS domain-containing protein [unclassified Tsukamurella]MDF0531366.1 STAS domain-containing protein [Tsukamurella sp. 8J]MDF0588572.1 STAS domain-containing protein [Tsukamurella sp. 8F]